MKLGINTVLWFWPFDAARIDILDRIAETGFETVEFALVDRSPETIEKIRKGLEKTGLGCVIDGVVGGEKDILSPHPDVMKAGRDHILETIDLCSRLGSNYLIGPLYSTGVKQYLFDEVQRKRSARQAVDILKEAAEYASAKGIKIALEPLNRYETNFVNTIAGLKALVDEIDMENLGYQIDTFHANIEEKSIYDAIIMAGKKLFHMHVPESDRGTPGTGLVKWQDMAAGLREIGYIHNIDMEIAHPHVANIRVHGAIWRAYDHMPDDMALQGYRFLKNLLESV
jgi:D-psicose/D-tagatose/L-ribulose 3-epimerase